MESGEAEVQKLEAELTKMNELYMKVHDNTKVLRDQSLIKHK
jgi:hypothetical protein